jgi:hypothetical protein
VRKALAWSGWSAYWLLLIAGYIFIASIVIRSASAHEWYSGQRNPVNGYGCCNGSDCHLIETEDWWEEAGVIYVRRNGATWAIPADQAQPSQDKNGKAAACIWGGKLRCFFMPVNF